MSSRRGGGTPAPAAPIVLHEQLRQFFDVRRLRNVRVEARVARPLSIFRLRVATHRDEARAPQSLVAPELPSDLVSVDVREPNVAQHDLGVQLAREFES